MAASWQGPHYIVLIGASALAFAIGYNMGGRGASVATTAPPPGNASNGIAPFPGADGNGQAPRARPDENELIARNAEVEEGSQPQRPRDDAEAGGDSRRDREARDTRRPREDPVEETFDEREQDGYGPEGE